LSELTNNSAFDSPTGTEVEKDIMSSCPLPNRQLPPDASVGLPVPHLYVQRVELVDLLTDVAGVLREKFQSKQCFNLCYSVNRESKQILIDLLPFYMCTKSAKE